MNHQDWQDIEGWLSLADEEDQTNDKKGRKPMKRLIVIFVTVIQLAVLIALLGTIGSALVGK